MQDDPENFENEDQEEYEEEEQITDLCRPPRVRGRKEKRILGRIIRDGLDIQKRQEAQKAAAIQDASRRHTEGNRYDVNSYAGGPTAIPDLCVVEKKKVR